MKPEAGVQQRVKGLMVAAGFKVWVVDQGGAAPSSRRDAGVSDINHSAHHICRASRLKDGEQGNSSDGADNTQSTHYHPFKPPVDVVSPAARAPKERTSLVKMVVLS